MFREDFAWGVASSAYQIEGRDKEDGCGKNIWDTFTEEGRVYENQNAYVSCDEIHRYKEDFALMRLLGIRAYRFSLSWARILPEGTGRVNEKAIALYRNMILEMKKNGITPYITLYHWEFPQALQDKGGWLNEDVIGWFGEYAKVVAENFSDLCEYFFTLNEPQCFVGLGHLSGVHAPGKKMEIKETFQIAHNALRAHGQAVINLRKYAKQEIKIGYAPTCGVAYPATDSKEDIEAAKKKIRQASPKLAESSETVKPIKTAVCRTTEFYAYGRGRFLGRFVEFADAAETAYNSMGFVTAGRDRIIWVRGNRASASYIRDITSASRLMERYRDSFESNQTMEDGTFLLDASGSRIAQVLYFVGQNIPVLAYTGEGTSMYLTGYDQTHVRVYHPESGATEVLSMETANQVFGAAGYDFICCVPGA